MIPKIEIFSLKFAHFDGIKGSFLTFFGGLKSRFLDFFKVVWELFRYSLETPLGSRGSPTQRKIRRILIPQRRVPLRNDPRGLIGLSALFTVYY